MENKTADKKEQIMKAAADCFARYGYEKTTLDDIGKMVRLNKTSLYYYYKNKEEIFLEFVIQISTKEMTILKEKLLPIANPEEKIITYFIERLLYYGNVVNKLSLSMESLKHLQPTFSLLYVDFRKKEKQFIAELVEQINQSESDSNDIAEALFVIFDGIKHQTFFLSTTIYAEDIDSQASIKKLSLVMKLLLKNSRVTVLV